MKKMIRLLAVPFLLMLAVTAEAKQTFFKNEIVEKANAMADNSAIDVLNKSTDQSQAQVAFRKGVPN